MHIDADTHGFDDELLDLLLQQAFALAGARLGPFGYDRANAGMNFQPALLNEV